MHIMHIHNKNTLFKMGKFIYPQNINAKKFFNLFVILVCNNYFQKLRKKREKRLEGLAGIKH